jgi:beta-barrel assembly-enhancing protease
VRAPRRRLRALLLAAWILAGTVDATAYPIAREREIGERFSLEAAAALPLVRDPTVLEFVNRLGQRIVSVLEGSQLFAYRFHVVRDSQLNAFAVPGGFVYLNSGLILRARTDAELAGVLGHEVAHVHAHHVVRQQEKTQLLSYASLAGLLLAAVHPALAAAVSGAGTAVSLSYQREFEREADYMGLRYLGAIDLDRRGMISFMKRMWQEQRTTSLEIPPYWLSHPMTDERITNLESALRDLPADAPPDEPTWDYLRVQTILAALTSDPVESVDVPASTGDADRRLALEGLALLHRGDPVAGRKALETADGRGVPGLGAAIGLAAVRQGDVAGALRILRGRLEVEPGDVVARATLGTALLRSGDLAGAREELHAVLEVAPYLDEAEADLAQSYGRAGDEARGFYHLARALELRGDLARSIANYEKVAERLPEGTSEGDEARRRLEALRPIESGRIIGRHR